MRTRKSLIAAARPGEGLACALTDGFLAADPREWLDKPDDHGRRIKPFHLIS
jgi:hypothetical protein